MRLFRPRVILAQLVLYSAPLMGTIAISVPGQPIEPGYDTYQTEVLFDMDIEGDPHQHLVFRMGGQAVIHRASSEIIKSVTSEFIIPIDGFSLFPGGFTLSDYVVDASPEIVPDSSLVSDVTITAVPVNITWPPPFIPLPPPTPIPRACWEVCWDLYFDAVHMFVNFVAPHQKGNFLSIHSSLPLPLCIPTFVQSLPFSTFSPTVSTVTPENAFPKILSCMISIPMENEANEPAGKLNTCEMTLYPAINSYQTRWNLSFSRLDPAGPSGAATMTGPTRIVGGWFFHEGSLSQQIQAIHVSGNGISLEQSLEAFSYGKMVSNTGNLPAQSFFSGFVEVTIDGIPSFNKTPILLQTSPEGVNSFPFQNVLHYASNCPIELFRVSDPDGTPAFEIDSLGFVCTNTLPWQIPSYGIYLECRTPSGLPLPGIPASLYSGSSAAGSPIASATTDSEGILIIRYLPFGDYSARVEMPPGYTAVSDLIQDFPLTNIGYTAEFYGALGGRGFGGNPPSLPGRETFQMTMNCDLELNGATESLTLNGPVTFQRGAPFDAGFGNQAFEAEIVSGQLTGSHPVLGLVRLRESPTRPSQGRYSQTAPDRFYPCESYFDLFFELSWTGQDWIRNATAVRVFSPQVDAYPPIGELFQGPQSGTELDDGSMPVPPRISKLKGRCIPGYSFGNVYVLLPPEQTPTPTATITPIPTPSPTATRRPGDTTGDTVLNVDDVFIFSRFFRKPPAETPPGCNPVDDAIVDQKDLLVLIHLWITENGD